MTEREFAVSVVRRLREAGHEALWAGGCVRDELLGLVPGDYDVATSARPEEVSGLFRRTVAVGVSFGVVQVLGPRTEAGPLSVEVATFRADAGYSDGRHPDAVVFSSAREDALRRDFTINGMFFDPLENQLIDYVGGQEDLNKKLLRAIGDPAVRFAEDKLRLLRAARIATRFDLTIEARTAAAIRSMAGQILVVSAERIADELRKLLVSPHRARGVNLLLELGLAAAILPELVPMKGLPQGSPHEPSGVLDVGVGPGRAGRVRPVVAVQPDQAVAHRAGVVRAHEIDVPRPVRADDRRRRFRRGEGKSFVYHAGSGRRRPYDGHNVA